MRRENHFEGSLGSEGNAKLFQKCVFSCIFEILIATSTKKKKKRRRKYENSTSVIVPILSRKHFYRSFVISFHVSLTSNRIVRLFKLYGYVIPQEVGNNYFFVVGGEERRKKAVRRIT